MVVWRETEVLIPRIEVRLDGKISVPLIDDVQAAGRTPLQLKAEISERLKEFITAPVVTVVVASIGSKLVYVIGEVSREGPIQMQPEMRVLDAIGLAGGLNPFAGRSRIKVIRSRGGAAAEFNFYVDPHAARVVFEAGFDITVVPWAPLTLNDAVFSREQLAGIGRIGTPLSQFFLQVCGPTLAFDEAVGIPGTTHPDSLSVAVLLHTELVLQASDYHVAVEAESILTRGYAAMSWGVHGLDPNARVIERADAARFHQYLTNLLNTPTAPNRPFTTFT